MEKFLYLKLGRGNCLADYWLSKDNVFKKPAVAIYFGKITTRECRKLISMSEEELNSFFKHKRGPDIPKKSDFLNQIKPFIEAGDNRKAKFVTIARVKPRNRRRIYIYEPESQVDDMPKNRYKEYDDHLSKRGITTEKTEYKTKKGELKHNVPKIMFVKILVNKDIEKVPHVLATLPCSQYFTRATCREIDPTKYWGAVQAIKRCLKQQIEPIDNAQKLMKLLSPYELETLMFLILKNEGLHVPAWRGGTLKDIDIIGHNRTDREIKIGTDPQVTFKPSETKTFQVKKKIIGKPKKIADWTVTVDFEGKSERVLKANWLLEQVRNQEETRKWLSDSLHWVPNIESLINKLS